MSSNAGAVVQEDYHRPRRADPDTVAYLRSLPLDEVAANEEVRKYVERKRKAIGDGAGKKEKGDNEGGDIIDDGDVEYPQSLAASLSAIDEIRHEVASLACDEHGSQAIETMARIGATRSDIAARKMLAGLAGYHLHLAAHRYASHVVQTILSCAVAGHPDAGGDAAKLLAEDGPEQDASEEVGAELPTLTELVLAMAEELLPHAPQLAVHVTASHVLRTLLCALGGVELVLPPHMQRDRLEMGGTRRGKNKSKKKKKKRKPPEDDASPGGGGAGSEQMRRVANGRLDPTDAGVKEALRAASVALWGGTDAASKPGELQQLACHPSAGPLLVVLLRVLSYASSPDKGKLPAVGGSGCADSGQEVDDKSITDRRLGIVAAEPTYPPNSDAHRLVKRLLCWDGSEDDPSKQPYAGDIIYGLSGEPRGSRVLEAIFCTSDNSTFDAVCCAGRFFEPGTFREYAEHDVSNFVLQTLLVSVRTSDQAEQLMKCVGPLVESGYLLDKSQRRGGVLWRTSEMCAKFRVGQDTLLGCIRAGYTTLLAADGVEDDKGNTSDGDDGVGGKEGKKKRHKKRKRKDTGPLTSIEECVPRLVKLKPPEKEGDRVLLDVAGVRTVYHMLRFSPKLCGDILNGVIRGFSCQELEWIANDGLGSRCIMDAIVEGPTDRKPFSHASKELLKKLSGSWVALSVERVGHHLVQNLFRALRSMDDKATLAGELSRGINRLGGNAMGRSVMASCAVKEYLEGEEAFKASVTKEMQREEWLKDVLEMDDSGAKDGGETKRKRKRKRKKVLEPDGNKRGNEKETAVESIISALSPPSAATG